MDLSVSTVGMTISVHCQCAVLVGLLVCIVSLQCYCALFVSTVSMHSQLTLSVCNVSNYALSVCIVNIDCH